MEQSGSDREIVEGADAIQDQVILAPEIMSHILDQLDVQSLKQVRLVCKSWLREAHAPMKKKGILHLTARNILKFFDFYLHDSRAFKRAPELPRPFRFVGFDNFWSTSPISPEIVASLLTSLWPMLLTRLDTEEIPLSLAIPIIIESHCSLERLSLRAGYEEGYLPPTDRAQVFHALRHFILKPWGQRGPTDKPNYVPSLVTWIVESSPKLKTYEVHSLWENDQLCHELLMKDNVTTLDIFGVPLSNAALETLLSSPLSRVENLRLSFHAQNDNFLQENQVLAATVAKCAGTLKVLELTSIIGPEGLADFQILCPHLKELTLDFLPYSNNVLSACFPNLRGLKIYEITVDVLGDSWRDLTPFRGLKTLSTNLLRFSSGDDYSSEECIKFLEKFPALETFRVNSSFVLHCCRLRASGDPKFSKLLEGVKHLELTGNEFDEVDEDPGFVYLAVLKEIETIAMAEFNNRDVLFLPYRDMPSLKVIQFPWCWKPEAHWPLDLLVEIARGVGKVVVTYCNPCYASDDYAKVKIAKNLKLFLDSAPNAEPGSDWREW